MTVAWLQRLGVGVSLLVMAAWVWAWWDRPVWAVLGAVALLGGMALAQALHFLLSAWVGRRSWPRGGPKTSPGGWVRAWWREVWLAWKVFVWWQPFRSEAWPDSLDTGAAGRAGLVLIHGYLCNRALWTDWMRHGQAEGRPCVAVTLDPVFGGIDDYAPAIEEAVQAITRVTGRPPVLLCHSMGGLAARAWWRAWRQTCRRSGHAPAALGERVQAVITLGTPHQGTWLARFSQTPNGRQMRLGSDWLQALEADEPLHERTVFECWSSDCDNVVFPPGVGELPGARWHRLQGVGHLGLLEVPELRQTVQMHWQEADRRSPLEAGKSLPFVVFSR
ncbi:esterase/lipase family protein [Tepidicella baoligensis]|uniref:esterase/lipase family protein n=1 Tax=Tepidicella baoligensis TaxID=2707016 RepID=UPI0015D9C688|nr:permease [Tepidicella baoligensis]